ncbi:sn-glycerol-3-phosphate ABC transporter ATP-binding protein UgpC [Pseudoxanthomonas broegbernensis]|uniref:sn-glycerol-3-phosphate ABC transporter ATP-binding protein UgpC n=1 Tax=Pseudoxanthomonas broegbernensis TaxID=83619 RepID=A0A7V8GPE0_9GAMM|nr:sn-glycerol-3-phosphate ABC transporter ATP-binding protein UgpC [Pseudoxanthomonas broegbernensis]KAF1687596.1 sn-glycerol-3-phosphate ABC transporter ATP-binding protein UgpC [Pseudoxanthomonas broegbernensis]MBB6064617.1 multiple sugar transport system ATP-binding protein [Pseudoxanthomonas broegbernensis]
MAGLQLEEVRKVYGNGQVAVHDASFRIEDGELMVLVGPSGCGKSTLLRMIAGLEEITSGTLRIGGRVVNDVAPKDRDIAMVFQSYALYPHMTVAENLGFGLKLRGQPRAEVERRVAAAAAMLGLEGMLGKRPREMSGGQRQRVALGRALVREPEVFLLDEPLSNLDAKLRHSTRTEIARLHRRLGTTMVYVTHDQVEAMTLGQRIVVLDAGRIQQIDTPMVLYERPANLFVAGFLGSPAMNLLEGELQAADGLRLAVDGAPAAGVPLPGATVPDAWLGRRVVLGVRPEHLSPAPGDGLPARVEVVEAVGSEAYLHLDFAGRPLVSRLPPQSLPVPGAELRMRADPAHLHFFDPQSGARLAI